MIDFDEIIDRRNTHAQKWDEVEDRYGVPSTTGIPLWIADMDFRAPAAVNAALQQMAEHGVHGYYGPDDSFREALVGWMARRHDWQIQPEWALQTHGLGNALAVTVQIGDQRIKPFVTLAVGGFGHEHSEPVVRDVHRISCPRHLPAKSLALDKHRSGLDPGDIEGLACRHEGDQQITHLWGNLGCDAVAVTGHDQIVMHLVTDKDDLVAKTEISHLTKLVRSPDPAARIVRRTQEKDFLITGQ